MASERMEQEQTPVDRLYKNFDDLVVFLGEDQPSLRLIVEENFKKSLVLATASYFEKRICDILENYADQASRGNSVLCALIKNKVISRQYHTFFDWERSNANKFWGLLGEEFKSSVVQEIKERKDIDEAIKVFLEIGNTRNRLVHENFAAFTVEKTAEEIYEIFKKARAFPDFLESELEKFQANTSENM